MVYINGNNACKTLLIEPCDECDEQYQQISRFYSVGNKNYSAQNTKQKSEPFGCRMAKEEERPVVEWGRNRFRTPKNDIQVTERQDFLIQGADIHRLE